MPFTDASAGSRHHRSSAASQPAEARLGGWHATYHAASAYRLDGWSNRYSYYGRSRYSTAFYLRSPAGRRYARYYGGGLQCVPFARDASGIELSGNAWTWWEEAAGVYERGAVPEPGSVLSFRPNGAMRLGHVAVVSRVVDPREIEIDHANWGSAGAVARGIPVVDVSPDNDWTAVRVGLGDGGFGSIYPTHGFIYDRPDRGTVLASRAASAPQLDLDPAPRDLRPYFEQIGASSAFDEVAEAPAPHHSTHYRHHRRY